MSSTDDRPRARFEELVTRDLESGETVIYDRKRDRVHCLNRAAVLVWQHCDGTRTIADLAQIVHDETGLPQDDAIVDLALTELRRAKLLEAEPEGVFTAPLTRRQAVQRLSYGAVIGALLPVVASIVAPSPAAAASCLPAGARCSLGDCCPPLSCSSGICVDLTGAPTNGGPTGPPTRG